MHLSMIDPPANKGPMADMSLRGQDVAERPVQSARSSFASVFSTLDEAETSDGESLEITDIEMAQPPEADAESEDDRDFARAEMPTGGNSEFLSRSVGADDDPGTAIRHIDPALRNHAHPEDQPIPAASGVPETDVASDAETDRSSNLFNVKQNSKPLTEFASMPLRDHESAYSKPVSKTPIPASASSSAQDHTAPLPSVTDENHVKGASKHLLDRQGTGEPFIEGQRARDAAAPYRPLSETPVSGARGQNRLIPPFEISHDTVESAHPVRERGASHESDRPAPVMPLLRKGADAPRPSGAATGGAFALLGSRIEVLSPRESGFDAHISIEPGAKVSASDRLVISFPDLPAGVARQVSQAVLQTGNRQTEIRMTPHELGRVRIRVQSLDGSVVIHISADRPETIELMRRNIEVLAQELHDAGFEQARFLFSRHQDGGRGDADPETSPAASEEPASGYDAHPDTQVSQVLHLGVSGRVDLRF